MNIIYFALKSHLLNLTGNVRALVTDQKLVLYCRSQCEDAAILLCVSKQNPYVEVKIVKGIISEGVSFWGMNGFLSLVYFPRTAEKDIWQSFCNNI